jgi:hypothetical protein
MKTLYYALPFRRASTANNRSSKVGETRKFVARRRLSTSGRSSHPFSAARSNTPRVPVTVRPSRVASSTLSRSSMSTRSALISSARRMASRSPTSRCGNACGSKTAGTPAQFRASQVVERSTVSRSRAFAADLVRQRRTSEPERVHRVWAAILTSPIRTK